MYSRNILILTLCACSALGVNHWILKDDGRITQKIDSPFYMREPDNLIAFLDQIRYNEHVESSYLELLRQRQQIVEHLRFSVQFSEDLVEQAQCAMDYYLMEKRMSYLEITPAYLKRISLPELSTIDGRNPTGEPRCQLAEGKDAEPCCFDHLDSFRPEVRTSLHLEQEESMNIGKPGSAIEIVRRLAVEGLLQQPRSWKFHTISSYYWRTRGQVQEALECARLGVMLAPQALKDIPLLSLGTILFRSGRLSDADIILTAAVEHAPNVAENHIALASSLAMKHDFKRSLYHFDEAERLDPSYLPRTLPVRNFIGCLDNLTKKTAKMYSYVQYMKNEVKEFKRLKYRISQNHEKLIQQQVPLGARQLDTQISIEDFLKRGQYCSTRTLAPSQKPVLFCDFYSDMQMRLESNDVDIESLERDLRLTSEAVIKQITTGFRKDLNFDEIKTTKAQMPVLAGGGGDGSGSSGGGGIGSSNSNSIGSTSSSTTTSQQPAAINKDK